MPLRTLLSSFLVGVSLLVAVPATALGAPAPVRMVVGSAVSHRFVALGMLNGGPVFRLTADAKRRYGKHSIQWQCIAIDESSSGGGEEPMTTDADPIFPDRGDDYCQFQVTVSSVKTEHHDRGTSRIRRTRHLRQTIVLTAEGKDYVRRVRGAAWINLTVRVSEGARDPKTNTFSNVADFADAAGALVLPTAEALVPAGRTGVWGEGSRFRVTRGLTGGAQLFYEFDDANRVVTTNVTRELSDLNDPRSWWFDTSRETARETHR